jgi:hypothetical protein
MELAPRPAGTTGGAGARPLTGSQAPQVVGTSTPLHPLAALRAFYTLSVILPIPYAINP